MSTAGLAASWAASLLAAWAFATGLLALPGRRDARDSALRALWLSGIAAASAAVALGAALVAAELDVAFVAAHVALNLTPLQRLSALWSAPAGAALPAAACVALATGVMELVRPTRFGGAVAGATCMALLASSVAATPFARLAWQPAEGLGLPPELLESASVAARIALTLAIGVVARLVAEDADRAGLGADVARDGAISPLLILASSLLLAAALLAARGSFAAGSATTPAPVAGFAATLLVPLAASACIAATRRGVPLASLLASVGTLGATLTAILASSTGLRPLPVKLLAAASLAAAVAGAVLAVRARRPRGAAPRERRTSRRSIADLPAITLALALLVAAAAAIGEASARTATVRLASGGSATFATRMGAPVVLSHQGVSRYEGASSHIEALALDVAQPSKPGALLSVERRDYVDTRESPIATAVARPAVHTTSFGQLRAVLDSVAADESVVVRVASVPLGFAWRGAVILALLAAVLALLPLSSPARSRRGGELPTP